MIKFLKITGDSTSANLVSDYTKTLKKRISKSGFVPMSIYFKKKFFFNNLQKILPSFAFSQSKNRKLRQKHWLSSSQIFKRKHSQKGCHGIDTLKAIGRF